MKKNFINYWYFHICGTCSLLVFVLLGCPFISDRTRMGVFCDSVHLFNLSNYLKSYNLSFNSEIFSKLNAIFASGVFNIFVIVSTLSLVAICLAIFAVWKLQMKNSKKQIENLILSSKIAFSIDWMFSLISLICCLVFVFSNASVNISIFGMGKGVCVGCGVVAIFVVLTIGLIALFVSDFLYKYKDKLFVKNKNKPQKKQNNEETESDNNNENFEVEVKEIGFGADLTKNETKD